MRKIIIYITILLLVCSSIAVFTSCEKDTTSPVVTYSISGNTFTINDIRFSMIKVEGGTFWMGAQSTNSNEPNYENSARNNESPVHKVTLSDYYICETEVSQSLWEALMGESVWDYTTNELRGPDKPAFVSYDEALQFIEKLNKLTSKHFRLPTEAEWEFAARGGNKSMGFIYSGSNNLDEVGWYFHSPHVQLFSIKTKIPNELGIYDMSGNVFEWCSDWYGDYSAETQINPTGPTSGTERVQRGGSSAYNVNVPDNCRIAYRNDGLNRHNAVGVRLVLMITDS